MCRGQYVGHGGHFEELVVCWVGEGCVDVVSFGCWLGMEYFW